MRTGSASTSVLVVTVAQLAVGWSVEAVDEVIRMVTIEELPGAPAVIAGIVDLRGRIVPVMDLRHRLGQPRRPATIDDRLVSVTTDASRLLIQVDAVHGLRSVDPDGIEPLTGELAATPHLTGVVRAPDGLLFVQDTDAFLSSREVAQLDAALVPATAAGR